MSIELHFAQTPAMPSLLLRAAIARKSGAASTVPAISASLARLDVSAAKLRRYNQVCGFTDDIEVLPATYPHIAAFSLHMEMLLHKAFPFSPMGIVHTRNRIEQRRPIALGEPLSLKASIHASREVAAGLEVDILTEAQAAGETVWTDLTTVLKRGKGKTSGAKKRSPLPDFEHSQNWELASNLGRRYAGVSGDYNPIHLFPASARLLGFKRHIAHGMWSKARCLAALQPLLNAEAFAIDVEFKTPLFLPASVTLMHTATDGEIQFSLRNAQGNRPHLNGTLTAL
jgi:acyl dehydratase